MKKLQTSDLTPALLQEVMKLSTAKEVVAFFRSKDLEVSEEGAQKLLDNLSRQAVELGDDDLDKVTGGCGGGDDSGGGDSGGRGYDYDPGTYSGGS